MLTFLLIKSAPAPRYYRVAIEYTLFGDYAVRRQWGKAGGKAGIGGAGVGRWYSNLRDAVHAAEACTRAALHKGYEIREIVS